MIKNLALLLIAGCNKPCYPYFNATDYTDFPVTAIKTDTGLLVDDPNSELDLDRVNRKITAVAECTKRVQLTYDQQVVSQCQAVSTGKVEACLVVKAAPQWRISPCTNEQVFSCDVPFASCAAKGQKLNPDCPCSCRAIIQDNGVIITTPNLKIFPAQLTTLLTGCYNPWVGPLAECANPSIGD
jgi:hypothetical protein